MQDVPCWHNLRQHVYHEALREGPDGLHGPRRPVEGGRHAGRRRQRHPRIPRHRQLHL